MVQLLPAILVGKQIFERVGVLVVVGGDLSCAFYLFYSSLSFWSMSDERIFDRVEVLVVVGGIRRPRGRGAAVAAVRPRY